MENSFLKKRNKLVEDCSSISDELNRLRLAGALTPPLLEVGKEKKLRKRKHRRRRCRRKNMRRRMSNFQETAEAKADRAESVRVRQTESVNKYVQRVQKFNKSKMPPIYMNTPPSSGDEELGIAETQRGEDRTPFMNRSSKEKLRYRVVSPCSWRVVEVKAAKYQTESDDGIRVAPMFATDGRIVTFYDSGTGLARYKPPVIFRQFPYHSFADYSNLGRQAKKEPVSSAASTLSSAAKRLPPQTNLARTKGGNNRLRNLYMCRLLTDSRVHTMKTKHSSPGLQQHPLGWPLGPTDASEGTRLMSRHFPPPPPQQGHNRHELSFSEKKWKEQPKVSFRLEGESEDTAVPQALQLLDASSVPVVTITAPAKRQSRVASDFRHPQHEKKFKKHIHLLNASSSSTLPNPPNTPDTIRMHLNTPTTEGRPDALDYYANLNNRLKNCRYLRISDSALEEQNAALQATHT